MDVCSTVHYSYDTYKTTAPAIATDRKCIDSETIRQEEYLSLCSLQVINCMQQVESRCGRGWDVPCIVSVTSEAENPGGAGGRGAEPPKIWLSMGQMKNVKYFVMPDVFRMKVQHYMVCYVFSLD